MPRSGGCSGLSTEPLQRQSFLLPERQAALAAAQGRRGEAPPYLVESLHNSAEGEGLTQPTTAQDVDRKHPCDNWRSIRGSCTHASTRWLYVRCKRRDCAGCSKVRQWKHASRIANGIRVLGVEKNPDNPGVLLCAFMVLTYADPRSADPEFKAEAVKLENSFIRWLRAEQKKLGNDHMEYAKTWEIQPRSQRLHTNLVVGPWMEMDQKEIARRWQSSGLTAEEIKCISLSPRESGQKKCEHSADPDNILSPDHVHTGMMQKGGWIEISWVRDDQAVSKEATKALSPDGLSSYLTKIEQMVPDDWHRAISFSKGYPKLTVLDPPERVGEIRWESERHLEPGVLAAFLHEKGLGWWIETEKGSGEFYDGVKDERCRCFDWKVPEVAVESYYHPPEALDLSPASEIEARQLVELYS
jgi:hypothetical protein